MLGLKSIAFKKACNDLIEADDENERIEVLRRIYNDELGTGARSYFRLFDFVEQIAAKHPSKEFIHYFVSTSSKFFENHYFSKRNILRLQDQINKSQILKTTQMWVVVGRYLNPRNFKHLSDEVFKDNDFITGAVLNDRIKVEEKYDLWLKWASANPKIAEKLQVQESMSKTKLPFSKRVNLSHGGQGVNSLSIFFLSETFTQEEVSYYTDCTLKKLPLPKLMDTARILVEFKKSIEEWEKDKKRYSFEPALTIDTYVLNKDQTKVFVHNMELMEKFHQRLIEVISELPEGFWDAFRDTWEDTLPELHAMSKEF